MSKTMVLVLLGGKMIIRFHSLHIYLVFKADFKYKLNTLVCPHVQSFDLGLNLHESCNTYLHKSS